MLLATSWNDLSLSDLFRLKDYVRDVMNLPEEVKEQSIDWEGIYKECNLRIYRKISVLSPQPEFVPVDTSIGAKKI